MTRTATRTYTYIVTGSGQFPFDMLRYDSCHPKHEADSGEIERSCRVRARYSGPMVRNFRVTLVGPREPTRARWASFGWTVESVA